MRKTLVVAIREYLAAVKTKSFLISLILLPIMMSGGVIAQKLGQKIGDTSTRRIAVIDRTPGQALYPVIQQAVLQRNQSEIFENGTGRQIKARFELVRIEPADPSDAQSLDRERLELSNRVRAGEWLAYVEIGSSLLEPASRPAASSAGAAPEDRWVVRYCTNRPTYRDFANLLQSALPAAVFDKRLAARGMNYEQLRPLLAYPRVVDAGLTEQRQGKIAAQSESGQIAAFAVPLALLFLMFIVVIVGASPLTANVVEEKQLRIAEVLLGSVRPFELMMGKLLGGVAVALTLAAIYFGGAYIAAFKQGFAGYISGGSIAWFLFFTILGTLMYGSLFVAAGASASNIKEAQSIIMPVMLLVMLPFFVLGNMIQDPSGVLATAASFFPLSAPMIMTARIAVPPGVPVWQAILSAAVAIATTIVLVWAAGRIFRVGILMQGQGAKPAELARWIMRG